MWPARGRAPGLKWTGHVTCKLSFSMVRQLSCQAGSSAATPCCQAGSSAATPCCQVGSSAATSCCQAVAAQLPGWQLSCRIRQLSCQTWAAELPSAVTTIACMHLIRNHPAKSAPLDALLPSCVRPQGMILRAHAAELARDLRHSAPPRRSRAGGTERSSEFGCVLMCGSPLCVGRPNGAQAARCPLVPRIVPRNLPVPCTLTTRFRARRRRNSRGAGISAECLKSANLCLTASSRAGGLASRPSSISRRVGSDPFPSSLPLTKNIVGTDVSVWCGCAPPALAPTAYSLALPPTPALPRRRHAAAPPSWQWQRREREAF